MSTLLAHCRAALHRPLFNPYAFPCMHFTRTALFRAHARFLRLYIMLPHVNIVYIPTPTHVLYYINNNKKSTPKACYCARVTAFGVCAAAATCCLWRTPAPTPPLVFSNFEPRALRSTSLAPRAHAAENSRCASRAMPCAHGHCMHGRSSARALQQL